MGNKEDRYIRRQRRRSLFMLNDALFPIASSVEKRAPGSLKSFLLPLGIGVAVGTAFSLFKSGQEPTEELPGVVPEEVDDPPAPPKASAQEKTGGSPPAAVSTQATEAFRRMERSSPPPLPPIPAASPAPPSSVWTALRKAIPPPASPAAPYRPPQGSVSQGTTATLGPSGLSSTKLDRKFRDKQPTIVTGFDGAQAINSKNGGTFTVGEAKQLTALKLDPSSRTGVARSMPPEVESKIIAYSRKHGVDERLALKIARMESGGNPNAISSTGAIGVYQFTGGTATAYGITNRFDLDQNIEGGILLLRDNANSLVGRSGERGFEPTYVNLYLFHQLGQGGARELLQAARDGKSVSELSAGLRKQLSLNYGGKTAATAAGYIETTRVALEGKPAIVVASRETVPSLSLVSAKEAAPKKKAQAGSSSAGSFEGAPPAEQLPQSVVRAKNGVLIKTT